MERRMLAKENQQNIRRQRDRTTLVAVIGLTVIGLVIRLLYITKSLLFDDWITLQFAQMSWVNFFSYLRFENTPPLFFLLARFWGFLFPDTEAWMRLLPIVFSVSAIPLFFLYARSVTERNTAVVATFLFAFAAVNLTESHAVRAYSLVAFLAILFMAAFLRWQKKHRRQDLARLIAIALAGVSAHLQFVLVLIASIITVLINRSDRIHWRQLTLSGFVLGGLFTPWMINNVIQRAPLIGPAWINNLPTDIFSYVIVWVAGFINIGPSSPGFGQGPALLVLGIVLLLCFALKNSLPRIISGRRPLYFHLLLIASAVVGSLVFRIIAVRYFIVVFPSVCLLLAELWSMTKPRSLANIALTLILVPLGISAIPTMQNTGGHWREFASFLENQTQSHDLIIVSPFADASVLRYYYRGAADINVVATVPIAQRTNDAFADILQYNFQQTLSKNTLGMLDELTANRTTVWLVSIHSFQDDFFNTHLIDPWFLDRGWDKERVVVRQDGTDLINRYVRRTDLNAR